MKKLMNQLFHPKKTKLFWMYIILGIIGIVVGIMLMPVWKNCPDWVFWKDWGVKVINIIICICIVLYLILFLFGKIMKRTNGVIKVLTIIEFIILALIALSCIFQQQFGFIKVNGACKILGLALWCRGVVEIFRAYYHQKGNNDKYPIWWLVIAIILVTLGTYMFANPFFDDLKLLWIFVVLILLLSILFIVDGILAKPATKKSGSKKKQKNKENE